MRIPYLIEQNKSLFGTYSAMALKNIQSVFDHIQKITDIEDCMPERNPEDFWNHPVMQYLNREKRTASADPEKTATIMEKLLHNLPFLKIMAENQRDYHNKKGNNNTIRFEINCSDIFYVLNNMFRVLKTYRDITMHYIIKDDRIDNDDSAFLVYNENPLSFAINNYFTAALRNAKERYNYTTQDLAFIQDYRIDKSTKKTNFNFFLSMQSYNDDKKIHLSGVGVAQLICLFLEKKYINLFLAKLPIYDRYSEQDEECRIIRRALAINSIVLPKDRIRSDKRDLSTALDMLNELKRCPKELFETLSQENQDAFRVISSDYNEVLLMRHSDRFAQLSLQYIDSNRLFKNIRFHVNMGKLRYLFNAEKKCIDGGVRVRVLEHPINAFGRLDEMEQYRKQNDTTFGDTNIKIRDFENVKRDDACAANYPYIVDTYARYMLENNKIEMSLNNNKMPKIVKTTAGKWYVDKHRPDCRLSTLELPAMMFHMHLLGSAQTEKRIKDVYGNYMRLFKALSDGTLTRENIDTFNIARCDMPEKLLDAVSGENKTKSRHKHVVKTVDELLEETDRLIKNFKEKKKAVASSANKLGSRKFKRISSGKLADFLARDIVKFQPSLKKDEEYGTDRVTGMNYRIMQASIAVYNSMGDNKVYMEFYNMFKAARLVGDNAKAHPFLADALKCRPKNAVEFYEHYLNARKNYLCELKKNLDNDQESIKSLPFINENKNKWARRDEEFYQILGEIYSEDVPVELPRQMFDAEIKAALKEMPEMKDVYFDNANVTCLIGEYLKRVHNDDFQKFYEWKRNYRFMDLLTCKTDKKNSIVKQYLTTNERSALWSDRENCVEKYTEWAFEKKRTDRNLRRLDDTEYGKIVSGRISASRNDFQKNERYIRRYKVQDALMFFMVKDSMTMHIDFDAKGFKLQDIIPDAENGILSEIMPMDFIFEKNGKVYTIKSSGMKLKNYGDFFALANDKRMESLLKLLESSAIDKDEIDKEFDNYDTSRVGIVSLILNFEKYIYGKYPDIKSQALQGNHFDFSKMLDELISKGDLNEREKYVMRKIRNSFSHNSYPERGIVEIKTLPEIAKHLIDIFGTSVTRLKQ